MWSSAQLIGKDIRASSQLFIRRAADVISEACFTAMIGDRHDGFQHDHSCFDTVMICMNFNNYASLVTFFIIPVLFCSVLFLNTKLHIPQSVSCV